VADAGKLCQAKAKWDDFRTDAAAKGPALPKKQPAGLDKTLADNPSIKSNQDLINHFYDKGGGTWEGVVSDMATNQFLHIGQWTLNGSQLLAASHVAWAERYLDGYNCTLSQIPYFKVTYRSPIGWSSGGTQYNGTLSAAKEGGPCAGKQGFVASGSGSAVTVQAGS